MSPAREDPTRDLAGDSLSDAASEWGAESAPTELTEPPPELASDTPTAPHDVAALPGFEVGRARGRAEGYAAGYADCRLDARLALAEEFRKAGQLDEAASAVIEAVVARLAPV